GDDKLRIAGGVGGEESGEILAPEASAREIVGDFVEILKGVIALIQEFELEPAELAETLHGRRFEDDDNGAGNSEQGAAQSIENGGGGVVVALALRIRPEGQKYQAGVGRAASETEAGDGESAFDFRKILGDGGHLLADFPRVFERRSDGSLNDDDEVALIFGGNEGLGHVPEDEVSETESGEKQDQCDGFKTQKRAEGVNVAIVNRAQEAVDALEEPILFSVLATEQERGERGRKSKRVEGRNRNRKGNGERELAEQNPGCAGKEGARHEDGDQHQRRGDDGAGDFLHGVGRGFDGIQFASLQVALNVFYDDDGVVDHEAGGERDAEQGQRVDGEAEQLDEGEGPDERDRDGDGGDDGGAPVFEENEDDEDNEEDRLAEG